MTTTLIILCCCAAFAAGILVTLVYLVLKERKAAELDEKVMQHWQEANELRREQIGVLARLARAVEERDGKPDTGGYFYSGIEWLACWMLDHAEGETITEETLRPWAAEAWQAHLDKEKEKK